MDKLGGKIPLLSILVVVLVQIGGGIVFLTNLSRDVQNNTDAIVHLVENDTAQYAISEISNARTNIETNKILIDQLLFDVEMNKQITSKLEDIDLSYTLSKLTRLETEIQNIKENSYSDNSFLLEQQIDFATQEITRLQVIVENIKRTSDDRIFILDDLKSKLIYLEQQFYALPPR